MNYFLYFCIFFIIYSYFSEPYSPGRHLKLKLLWNLSIVWSFYSFEPHKAFYVALFMSLILGLGIFLSLPVKNDET